MAMILNGKSSGRKKVTQSDVREETKTNFDGEIEAIHIALSQLCLRTHSFGKAVIFCDSSSAIQSISQVKYAVTAKVKQIKQEIEKLKRKGKK